MLELQNTILVPRLLTLDELKKYAIEHTVFLGQAFLNDSKIEYDGIITQLISIAVPDDFLYTNEHIMRCKPASNHFDAIRNGFRTVIGDIHYG